MLPPPNDPTEYAAAFEAVYQTPEDRRLYIEAAVKKGKPSFAHRVIASMLSMKYIPCVFTTNFDQLIEDSTTVTDQLLPAEQCAHMTVAAIDNADRAELCLRENRWPLLAKLHGDYQSVELKNTSEELKAQDAKMRHLLVTICSRFGIVVVGYSGRDASVMDALSESITQSNAFPGGIYWIARSAKSVLPAVNKFLEAASAVGISTTIVESPTFDELAGDIIDNIKLPDQMLMHIQKSQPNPILQDVPLPNQDRRKFPVLQCSAIPVLSIPTKALRIEVKEKVTTVRVRELIKEAGVKVLAVSNGRDVVGFGATKDMLKAFKSIGCQSAGVIELNPVKDSWSRGLLYEALIRALCRHKPLLPRLRSKGHSILVRDNLPTDGKELVDLRNEQLAYLRNAYSTPLFGTIPSNGCLFREGVKIRLDQVANRWWCIFEPFTDIEYPQAKSSIEQANKSSIDIKPISFHHCNPTLDWCRERWATRYNKS
jgi:hypothetical protein